MLRPGLAFATLAICFGATSCAVGGVASLEPTATPARSASATQAAVPTPIPTPTPSPTPSAPATYAPGDVVTVTSNGSPWANITVSKVAFVAKYGSGYLVDTPDAGNVYVQLWVTYEALTDGVSYNPFDWSFFNNDVAVSGYTFVSNGPKPELSSGDLPVGRRAEGWVVVQVPNAGRLVMSYGGSAFLNSGPIFEVLLRA